ncbi:transcriptional regulation of mitochondrial recombination-domain-containing protein [Microdochium bolleyi]|uniref:Large ribosomal subunit protein mL67 n=1 Tax=Microdochium bolleyi TaxID=196109 RepID=A0A136JK37_9PEZI|nr:transcriptional regulation of mitochondrial recombination-domain-containing protein [Microdochium bolleyi]
MALRAKSITQQLSRLSVTARPAVRAACAAASRPAARYLTTESHATTATSASAASVPPPSMVPKKDAAASAEIEHDQTGDATLWPHGHGDRIWFFRHILDGLAIFSLKRQFKANKTMRTIPFNGKKLKPAKFRKDYWEPFAMVEFPQGQSLVGLSVFHMLREAQFLHSYSWDPSQPGLTRDPKTGKTYSKLERGRALNAAMMPNSVADIAAVLGGLGKGNKIWAVQPTEDAPAGVRIPATVYWADLSHKDHAAEWPDNVTHVDAKDMLRLVEGQVPGESTPLGEKK